MKGNIGNFNITHTITVPSKMSDYDYDPSRPERRFLSTYIHTLEFSDPITDTSIITISFDSFTCAELIRIMYNFVYVDHDILPTPVATVSICKNPIIDAALMLSKVNGVIKLYICDMITPPISFDILNPNSMINTLSLDEIEEMFVCYESPEDDRW